MIKMGFIFMNEVRNEVKLTELKSQWDTLIYNKQQPTSKLGKELHLLRENIWKIFQ